MQQNSNTIASDTEIPNLSWHFVWRGIIILWWVPITNIGWPELATLRHRSAPGVTYRFVEFWSFCLFLWFKNSGYIFPPWVLNTRSGVRGVWGAVLQTTHLSAGLVPRSGRVHPWIDIFLFIVGFHQFHIISVS